MNDVNDGKMESFLTKISFYLDIDFVEGEEITVFIHSNWVSTYQEKYIRNLSIVKYIVSTNRINTLSYKMDKVKQILPADVDRIARNLC